MAKNPIKKKPETLRQQAQAASSAKPKPRRLKQTASKVTKPIGKARTFGQKEYYLPLPDNRLGQFLNKRRRFIPKYFRDAWAEVRQVKWPNRRETLRLTLAVFIFAVSFGLIVAVVDFGLERTFKQLLLK
ncbi:MAG: preprotein translocase subunit SecE [Patescibacteria group bacterium]